MPSEPRQDQPLVPRLPLMVGGGAVAVGLSLLGFGIAAVDFMGEQGAGGVAEIVAGAILAALSLWFTDWPRRRAGEEKRDPDETESPGLHAANVTHAVPKQVTPPAPPSARQAPSVEVLPEPPYQAAQAPPELTDVRTPDDVRIRTQAPIPASDPSLGIEVPPPDQPAKQENRLVVLGDSLSQGFQSLAMFNTDLSYPAIIARQLGCYDSFRHPEYLPLGGLPLNLEYITREMELRHGQGVNWWEQGSAASCVDDVLAKIRDYWQDGPGGIPSETDPIPHNLAIPGCDIRDLFTITADEAQQRLDASEKVRFRDRASAGGLVLANRILASARDRETKRALTPVEAAIALGKDGGIETLIVFIGVGNALGALLDLEVKWSDAGYEHPIEKRRYNVWRPKHFEAELNRLVELINSVTASHVIWATVPHVTIMPVARGVRGKTRPGSRYFNYYSRPWISDETFDPDRDPRLIASEARAIDSAIDQYNESIADRVREARRAGRDWLLLDVAGLFDQLAARRYVLDPAARPPWWEPYELPDDLAGPKPDTNFFARNPDGSRQGGLFSLDGVHPTTVCYAILAQRFIDVMAGAGVEFPAGRSVDFSRLAARDTLVSDPPPSITPELKALAWLDERLNWVGQLRLLLYPR